MKLQMKTLILLLQDLNKSKNYINGYLNVHRSEAKKKGNEENVDNKSTEGSMHELQLGLSQFSQEQGNEFSQKISYMNQSYCLSDSSKE